MIENLTIQNLTPQGGTQAEALRLQSCDKCVVRKADIVSLQDTLLWSGVIYAEDCYIAGNVDWIWGTGTVYFNRCEIKNLGRSGYIVQSRNGAGQYGYVFVDSKLVDRCRPQRNHTRAYRRERVPGQPRGLRQLHAGQPYLQSGLDRHGWLRAQQPALLGIPEKMPTARSST